MKNTILKFFNTKLSLFWILFLLCSYSNSWGQIGVKVTNASCHGKKDGKIDITVNGKNPPYSFVWNDGSTEDHLHDIGEGVYQVMITDRNGCTLEKTISVGVKEDKPRVKIEGGGDQNYCEKDGKDEIQLTAVASKCGECIYKWSTGSDEESIDVSNDGEYKITVTDTANCYKSDSTDVKFVGKDCEDEDDPEVDIPEVRPSDPNDMLGPQGFGPQKWVSVNDVLPYKIRFENDPTFATAPAQKVFINSPIDPHLNIYSFRLGKFGFGDFVFEVPENSTFYTTQLDVKDSLGVIVDVIAGIDVVKREAFWIFESKNPINAGVPNADLGFLLVNDSISHKGEGFVSFNIRPNPASHTGDSIHAIASIVFDIEKSLATPQIFNTIDALAPISTHRHVDVTIDSIYTYEVSAKDDYGLGGSGVKEYDLYISQNDDSYSLYAKHVPIDSAVQIKGDPNKTYCAYTVARDQVGNQELKTSKEACFSPQTKPFVRLKQNLLKPTVCQGGDYTIEWSSIGIDQVNIYASEDNGKTYVTIAENVAAKPKSHYFPKLFENNQSKEYLFKIADVAVDTLFDVSLSPVRVVAHVPVKIVSSNGLTICSGDSAQLKVAPIYSTYLWSDGSTLPSVKATTSKTFKIQVKDASGCTSKDSVDFFVNSFPNPLIAQTGPYKYCNGKPLTLNAPPNLAIYLWSTGDTLAQIKVSKPGKVSLKVTDSLGCEALSDTILVVLITDEVECEALNVQDGRLLSDKLLQVSPNPLSDLATFQISLPQSQLVSLKLFDARGIEVADIYKGKITGGTTYFVPYKPSETLANGLYVYKLFMENGEISNGKLILNR